MRYTPIQAGTLVSEDQRLVVQSALALRSLSQGAFAEGAGLNQGELNRMLRGHLVVRDDYARALNDLVYSAHPVQLAA